MNTGTHQHRIATGLICAISLWICYISFNANPAQAYIFPRIISVVLVLTAMIAFIKAMADQTKTGGGLPIETIKNITPGIIIGFVYFFWAAKFLGFYVATIFTVFTLFSVYDPKPNNKVMTWITRAVVSLVYVALLYAVFALVLNVFTPRGLFI